MNGMEIFNKLPQEGRLQALSLRNSAKDDGDCK
jgi:hypothetical protein